jgi:DNA-binding transcriptional LysR family regulator
LLAKHLKLRLDVNVDHYTRFLELLRQRAIDLFVADVTPVKSDPELEIIPVPLDEVLRFVHPRHPMAGRGPLPLGRLFAS